MDIILRVLKIVLVLTILGVAVNDLWRYTSAEYELGTVTHEAVARSASEVKPSGGDRGRVWQAGETYAQTHGATVYGFDLTDQTVHIWTRMPVKKTIVVHRVMALLDKKPQGSPWLIEDEGSLIIPSN